MDVYVASSEASEFLLNEYFTFWSFCIFREDIPFRWNANISHVKVCLSRNFTHFSSFFPMSKTVESWRIFQNLLLILALFSKFFIHVTIKKEESTSSNCLLLSERLHRTSTKYWLSFSPGSALTSSDKVTITQCSSISTSL